GRRPHWFAGGRRARARLPRPTPAAAAPALGVWGESRAPVLIRRVSFGQSHPAVEDDRCAPTQTTIRYPVGYGVIGSTTDSGSVSLGSSPGTPAQSAEIS